MKFTVRVLICIALLLSGCGKPATPADITSAKELAGVWHRTTRAAFGGEVYRQYTKDGTYRMGASLEELEAKPRVEGKFWFEGDQIVIQDTFGLPGWNACLDGQKTGKYDLEVLENGHIRFVLIEDECHDRAVLLEAGEMERVD